jgi:hypothetical protein
MRELSAEYEKYHLLYIYNIYIQEGVAKIHKLFTNKLHRRRHDVEKFVAQLTIERMAAFGHQKRE